MTHANFLDDYSGFLDSYFKESLADSVMVKHYGKPLEATDLDAIPNNLGVLKTEMSSADGTVQGTLNITSLPAGISHSTYEAGINKVGGKVLSKTGTMWQVSFSEAKYNALPSSYKNLLTISEPSKTTTTEEILKDKIMQPMKDNPFYAGMTSNEFMFVSAAALLGNVAGIGLGFYRKSGFWGGVGWMLLLGAAGGGIAKLGVSIKNM